MLHTTSPLSYHSINKASCFTRNIYHSCSVEWSFLIAFSPHLSLSTSSPFPPLPLSLLSFSPPPSLLLNLHLFRNPYSSLPLLLLNLHLIRNPYSSLSLSASPKLRVIQKPLWFLRCREWFVRSSLPPSLSPLSITLSLSPSPKLIFIQKPLWF